MSFLALGVVSNGWSALLPGSSLEAQCRRAVEAGYVYVELRQRALGDAEEAVSGDDRPWPLPDRLSSLRGALPELRFNLAVEAPFLTRRLDTDEPYLVRCVEAACALGPPGFIEVARDLGVEAANAQRAPDVLRLVDLSPAPALLLDADIERLAPGIAELAAVLAVRGCRLALENSRQPVSMLRAAIRRAAQDLPTWVPAPQLCWDPHNQIVQKLLPEDPLETARSLRAGELFEFHFKQGRGGELQPDVTDGDLDWLALLQAIHQSGFRGPALFEIPGGPDIWGRLERSTAYVAALLRRVEGGS